MPLLNFLEEMKTTITYGKLLTPSETEPPITSALYLCVSVCRFLTLFQLAYSEQCGSREVGNKLWCLLRPFKLQEHSASLRTLQELRLWWASYAGFNLYMTYLSSQLVSFSYEGWKQSFNIQLKWRDMKLNCTSWVQFSCLNISILCHPKARG